jgi:hypothetical protein
MKSRVNLLREVMDSLDGFVTYFTRRCTWGENRLDTVENLLDLEWLWEDVYQFQDLFRVCFANYIDTWGVSALLSCKSRRACLTSGSGSRCWAASNTATRWLSFSMIFCNWSRILKNSCSSGGSWMSRGQTAFLVENFRMKLTWNRWVWPLDSRSWRRVAGREESATVCCWLISWFDVSQGYCRD